MKSFARFWSRQPPHCLSALPRLGSVLLLALVQVSHLFAAEGPDFSAVQVIFNQHCLDCHAAQDPEGKLVMENFETLMKGGESGQVMAPGKSDESLLVRMIEGRIERDGKQKVMPPGKRKKLEASEIATITTWINAGAKPPLLATARQSDLALANLPKIAPKVPPRRAVNAIAFSSTIHLLAMARGTEVDLVDPESRVVIRTLSGHRGQVNSVAFSPDGTWLYAAAGEAGLFGEVREWRVVDGTRVRLFEGHTDAIYGMALSPDGKTLATGGYDQKINLWRIETVEQIAVLSGHNGSVYSLAFRPDGRILASGSADRTVKLWDVQRAERRDTLSQSLRDVFSVAFTPDGKRLFSAGADNRIRIYEVSEKATETTNPLIEAKFAHEGAILRLAFSHDGKTLATSADDRLVKLWSVATLTEKAVLEPQPDWALAIAFAASDKALVVGRFDGSVQYYDASGGGVLPLPKPELASAEPRGVQRATTTKVKLRGKNLLGLTMIRSATEGLAGKLIQTEPIGALDSVWVELTPSPTLPRGSHEIWVVSTNGESNHIQMHVDNLPQINNTGDHKDRRQVVELPVNIWSTFPQPGDADQFAFEAKAGQMIVFDASAQSIGSKADLVVTLSDSNGRVVGSNNDFDGVRDPFLAYAIQTDGRYTVRVHDLLLGGSADHYYRMTVGALPFVTGVYPLSVSSGTENNVELVGYNLPEDLRLKLTAREPGEMDVPLDLEKMRVRRPLKLAVSDGSTFMELEPNDQPQQAMRIQQPCSVNGRIWSGSKSSDVDLYQFDAGQGERWIIETLAAQRGSPVDTKIEVLWPDGRPIERTLLQAVRNSAVTFRGIDSSSTDCRVENWEEMELNQYLYLNGEVVKLFRSPQGPDSGFLFYTANGKRRGYFDTTSSAHAVDEPCYIVEPRMPGAKLVANGLPVFTVYFSNDDDADRRIGTDSKIHFTAPTMGSYLIRVTDTQGAAGERFAYNLKVRRPEPDFSVTIQGADPTVPPGSGQRFSVSVDRRDGFDGEVRIELSGLPPGFAVSSPLVIQAGQTEAIGTINAAPDALQPTAEQASSSSVTALALIEGRTSVKAVNNLGRIRLGEKPRLYLGFTPGEKDSISAPSENAQSKPYEIMIAPGQIVPAWLKVRRNGHEELITFTVENLPHGVIVDNIGLNGVLIPKEQSEREIFLSAARWVPEMDRMCFAIENQAGRQTSMPVLLKVRKGTVAMKAP
ncbi:MAG: hypothetical protein EXS31_03960 [Pedosphaera sp.]|nr:hypothetical protein [Pedosphaera sp.]